MKRAKPGRENLVRIQFWVPREERDAFEAWCGERNSSKNKVLVTMLRERTKTRDGRTKMTPPLRQQTNLEARMMLELVKMSDPWLAARVRELLDRIK